MPESPKHKSQAALWASLIGTVPLLYLLSAPWLQLFEWKQGYDPWNPIDYYLIPFDRLTDGPFLIKPLRSYKIWCQKAGGMIWSGADTLE